MTLEQALREIALLRARIDFLEAASGLFAANDDLNSPRTLAMTVKFDPRQWRGAPHKGKRFCDCSPEFLDAFAEALTWMADHPKEGADPKYQDWNRRDAARCRSYARLLRSGWKPPTVDVGQFPGDATDFRETSFDAPAFDAPAFDDDVGF